MTELLMDCQYCGERKIAYDDFKNGQQVCQDCETIRNTNPTMFDLIVKMMERKIEQADDNLRDYVYNMVSDDD